jgi:hypothetical protein
MIALLAFTLCMYLLVFCVVFVAYGHEKLATRAKISAIAPFLLAFAGVLWVAERLEEFG